MSKTRKFTTVEILRLLREYETMRQFKIQALINSGMPDSLLFEQKTGTKPGEFFSWIDGLSDDNIKSILEEKSHDK